MWCRRLRFKECQKDTTLPKNDEKEKTKKKKQKKKKKKKKKELVCKAPPTPFLALIQKGGCQLQGLVCEI